MNAWGSALAGTWMVVSVMLSACNFSVERPDPILLDGADTFPEQPDDLINDFAFDWRVEARDSRGQRAASPFTESFSGTMSRRYREVVSPSDLLSPLYRVQDEHRPREGSAFTRIHELGRNKSEQDWRWFAEGDQRLAGDSGARLLRPQIAVGDRFEVQFDYPGHHDTWRTFAEIEVLRTKTVETQMVDVEAYVVRIQGDDEDDGRFEGTDRYRFTKTLWISPHVGIVKEQWSIRERPGQCGYHLHTVRDYLLSSVPR